MTTKLWGGTIKYALIHAATMYDVKQSTKRGYNRYAIGQYLNRIDEVLADIDAGATPRQALIAGFSDRLLDHLLRAIGEPKFTREEISRQHIVYVPASGEK